MVKFKLGYIFALIYVLFFTGCAVQPYEPIAFSDTPVLKNMTIFVEGYPKEIKPFEESVKQYNKKIKNEHYILAIEPQVKRTEYMTTNPFLGLITIPIFIVWWASCAIVGVPPLPVIPQMDLKANLYYRDKVIKSYDIKEAGTTSWMYGGLFHDREYEKQFYENAKVTTFNRGIEDIFSKIQNDAEDIRKIVQKTDKRYKQQEEDRAERMRQEEEKIAQHRKKISEANGNMPWCVQNDSIDCIYEETGFWGKILGQEPEGTLVGNCNGFMGACTKLIWIEQNSVDGFLNVNTHAKPGVFIRVKHHQYTDDLGGKRIVDTVKRITE